MKLGTKIIVGFIGLIALAMALGAVAVFLMFGVQDKATILGKEYVPEMDKVGDIQRDTFLMRMNILGVILSGEEKYYNNGKKIYTQLDGELKDFKKFAEESTSLKTGRENAARMVSKVAEYWGKAEDISKVQGSFKATIKNQAKVGTTLTAGSDRIIDQTRREAEAAAPAALKPALERLVASAKMQEALLRLRLDIAAAQRDNDWDRLMNSVKANAPLFESSVQHLKEAAADNREMQAELKDLLSSFAEYRQMAEAIVQLAGQLDAGLISAAKVGEEVVKLTEDTGDAASTGTKVKAGETISELTTASLVLIIGLIIAFVVGIVMALLITRGITGPINRIITNLSEAGEQVAAASGQISSASQSLAEGATQQAASLEESSSALEEMASMTRQNADNAVTANQNMSQTQQQVSVGAEAVSNMAKAMDEINDSSEKISRIIKTIEEIAFQTNLLALNAAVEAARAGDAGKGFAVVADEVRNLAQRSAQAARDTADLIESTVARVKNGTEIVQQLQKSFVDVENAANSVAGLINEISAASNEQAQGVDQVNTAVAQMDKVTQTNAANAEESASAAEELNAQAEQLKGLVSELVKIVRGANSAPLETHLRTHLSAGVRPSAQLRAPMPHKSLITSHSHQPASSSKKLGSSAGEGKASVVKPNQVIPLDDDDDFNDF